MTFLPEQKIGLLVVNLGTPASPSVADVRRYLREFLMDGRVIDIPFIPRFLLVNGIIAPFRAPKSAKTYQELWTQEGSPLLVYGQKLCAALQEVLGKHYHVELAMRYQAPSIASALKKILDAGVAHIIVFPLFPQYASATTGSVIEKVMQEISAYHVIPEISFVNHYFHEPGFIEVFAKKAKEKLAVKHYDKVVFSYHGIPERQIRRSDKHGTCLTDQCCATWTVKNRFCYRAQCEQTSRLLAEAIGLAPGTFLTVYQSRLGKDPWIQPYADETIIQLATSGVKSVLALVPSFVADCLETTIEVGKEYKELFQEYGGEVWDMVESLNTDPLWIDFIAQKVKKHSRLPESSLHLQVS